MESQMVKTGDLKEWRLRVPGEGRGVSHELQAKGEGVVVERSLHHAATWPSKCCARRGSQLKA